MSTGQHERDAVPLLLPADLERKLRGFRGLVRRVKLTEAVCAAVCGVLLGYLAVFLLDRFVETPRPARLALLAGAVAACMAVPLALHAWVWRQRGLEQVARLLARTFPSLGDEVLGVIEIVRGGPAAGMASRALCAAAVAQVAERATHYDFSRAVPRARHRLWALVAALPLAAVLALALLLPAAAGNAWSRFLAPWRDVERFTFARIAPLPERLVVPHGEPAALDVALGEDSRWRPARAAVRIGRQPPLAAALGDGRYAFTLPPQLEPGPLRLAVGDARGQTRLEPMFRPEIAALVAEIELPDYLQRPGTTTQDVRGGTVTAVRGSRVAIVATATRDLALGRVDDAEVPVTGVMLRTPPLPLDEERKVTIEWRDVHGLAGARPLSLTVAPRPDEPPVVVAADLPASRDVLLNTDTLRFRVAVRDDFGIRRVGLEWQGLDAAGEDAASAAVKGDRLVQAGGPDREALDVAATFCPDALGIAPQAIVLRAFAEDYLPGRGRAYSTPVVIYVVDRAEHALVLNTRLQQFRQQASEVRDREMGLLAANKELRGLPEERLGDADTRGRLEAQAAAEAANGRRLERLVEEGEKLVQEALKNPEFEAATLEQLAEDIQTLADIAGTRMPGVAELLAQAARAEKATAGQPGAARPPERNAPAGEAGGKGAPPAGEPAGAAGESATPPDAGTQADAGGQQPAADTQADAGDPAAPPDASPPRVGEDRQPPGGGGQQGEPGSQPPVPQVVDRESSQQPAGPDAGGQPPSAGGGAGRLGLPSTQAGVAPPAPQPPQDEAAPPADEALDEAIAAQEELLEQFAKVADELAAVMARLEGSTFVKRLKLASREQGTIGSRIAELSAEAFGRADDRPAPVRRALGEVRDINARETDKVSALMDDLQAYFDRRQLPAFRTVLEEMKSLDALGSLRQLSDDILTEAGMSIAQAEFWSDTFDRLADDLVPPPEGGGSGAGDGAGAPRESVPPEVVLEVMKILEDEVTLREETRVAEQTRPALEPAEFADRGAGLARRQEALADRIVDLVDRLLEEPDGERSFGPEIELFEKVEEVMAETADILRAPDTGPKAIGAESEVIELLLAAQAAAGNQGGGGGGGGGGAGGATPGGGGGGDTDQSALALVGRGNRTRGAQGAGEKEQATGLSGRVLPEEFRAGLDDYFNRFEKERR